MSLDAMRTRIFADGADLETMAGLLGDPRIRGFTTNPTLMRKAGLTDYAEFARQVLDKVTEQPVSFEVFADEPEGMLRQARIIAGWGGNVYVKIPVSTTTGESTSAVVRELSHEGVKVNVTAVFTPPQIDDSVAALEGGAPAYISVFAGRIADAGVDPIPIVAHAVAAVADHPGIEVIWASPRQVLNLVQADGVGCHIITMTRDLLDKLHLIGRDLAQFSLDTVQMFHDDATAAGLSL